MRRVPARCCAGQKKRPADFHAAALDHRVADVHAADLIVAGLIIYPAFYSIYLSMLNKAQTRFIGLSNFAFLLSRDTFWMVVQQSAIFALSAVFFKALIGLITAHLVNNLPAKGQRKWRGMLLVPWVIPLALSTLGWWWLFDPTNSAFNYTLKSLGFDGSPG